MSLYFYIHVLYRNGTSVIAITPPFNESDVPMNISIKFAGLAVLNTTWTFQYRPDPVITHIEPLETIIV